MWLMTGVFVLAALLASASAWAQEDRPYFGIGAGTAALSGCPMCQGGDSALKLMAGYQFTPRFALEFAYSDFGTVTLRDPRFGFTDTWHVSTTEASAIGTWPLGEGVAFQARGGVYGTLIARSSFASFSSSSDGWQPDGTGVTFGTGLRFRMSERTLLRFEWQRFNQLSIDVFSLNLVFFPGD